MNYFIFAIKNRRNRVMKQETNTSSRNRIKKKGYRNFSLRIYNIENEGIFY